MSEISPEFSRALVRSLFQNYSQKVVLGAGGIYDEGWLPTNQDVLDICVEDHWAECFPLDSIEALLAEHVWEHLTLEQAQKASELCFRYLKPGGYLRLAVPDGLHPNPDYIDFVKPKGNGSGDEYHQVLYTYQSLSQMLCQVGFSVQVLEFFDEKGFFHCENWEHQKGTIHRSFRFCPQNANGHPNYTSIIVDAFK